VKDNGDVHKQKPGPLKETWCGRKLYEVEHVTHCFYQVTCSGCEKAYLGRSRS